MRILNATLPFLSVHQIQTQRNGVWAMPSPAAKCLEYWDLLRCVEFRMEIMRADAVPRNAVMTHARTSTVRTVSPKRRMLSTYTVHRDNSPRAAGLTIINVILRHAATA